MNRHVHLCSVLVLAGMPLLSAEWTDTFIGYRYGTNFHLPSNPSKIEYRIINLTGSSEYFLGSNFFCLDMMRSSTADPATGPNGGGTGAQESFLSYRTGLSLGKVFHGHKLNHRVVRDLSLTAGFDWNSKSNQLGGEKLARLFGATLSFNVPRGFWDVTIASFKEKNHNSFGSPSQIADFKTTFAINTAWNVPFEVAKVPMAFKGFVNYIGRKGVDPTGVQTAPETLARPCWMWDLGSLLWQRRNTLWVGAGYEYWDNKYGNPSPIPTGTPGVAKPNITTHCPLFMAEWHF